jgi:hypothetical protein
VSRLNATDIRYGRRGGRWATEPTKGPVTLVPARCGCPDRADAGSDMLGHVCPRCQRPVLAADEPVVEAPDEPQQLGLL